MDIEKIVMKTTHQIAKELLALPDVAAIELLDGAYDIIEIWKAESPSQVAWKRAWLAKAKELGANPSW